MLIYIIHNDEIYDFRLSNKVFGKFVMTDYDRFGIKRNLVNIEARDGNWYMFENEEVKISYNGKNLSNISLVPHHFYILTIRGTEQVVLYTMPLYDDSYTLKELSEEGSIIIGKDSNSDIVYSGEIDEKQLEITYKNNQWSYKVLSNKQPIFINKKRVKGGVLNNYDTIFIVGLRIVVFHNKLLVNNPSKVKIVYKPNKFKPVESNITVPDNDTKIRTYTNFYDESDYYFKTPVVKSSIKTLELRITEPPNKEDLDKSSVLMTIIPMLIFTLSSILSTYYAFNRFLRGESSKEEMYPMLLMSGGMIFLSILWPFIERRVRNVHIRITNKLNKRNYTKYLKKKEEKLKSTIVEQRMILDTNNLSLKNCKRAIENKTPELFHRSFNDEDFLNISLGRGDVPLDCKINYSKPDYVVEKDELLDAVDRVLKDTTTIKDAPVVVSLKQKNVIAFIVDDRALYYDYMAGIILQLITLQSYQDLKLVVLTTENSELEFLKNTNYCWNNDHSFRYYATNIDEAQQISTEIERELIARKKTQGMEIKTQYLVISDSMDMYRNLNIVDDIIHSDKRLGFGLLMYDLSINNIPNDCENFVNVTRKNGTMFATKINNDLVHFVPSIVSEAGVDVDQCARIISNIPIKNNAKSIDALPDSIGFLQMYGAGNVDQLNIQKRWEKSAPFNSLSVPLGVDSMGNLINLDLHEKMHGPHGLVAGMTGSGKSETIITYILSLALNFRPDEVQFVLIDYKGGGLAGAFENRTQGYKLPHLVGTITNLDVSEMNRTLVSINSELKRRQRLFNKAKESLNTGNIDIYKYQKLYRENKVEEPLSHLFIICDEFAELKAQQPDFMDELVSAARIGRSLGIHLILATQKPSGVVDDQIWSNARFKICCKVQTTEDSNEMLKKPDAAYLKNAGSFYLQVGYDEYFAEGQSAYSGFPYVPTDLISTKIDYDIKFLNNIGDIYKSIVKDSKIVATNNNVDLGEELINILKYIINESEQAGFKYKQLWLDNVPQTLYYNNLANKYNVKSSVYNIEPIIGEFDDPRHQRQGYVSLPLTTDGNTYIIGAGGSGKSTLLSTMIYSTILNHNCDEVNIYIVDLGTEKLKKFVTAPQVGDVITADDIYKIPYLFYMLEHERDIRHQYYSKNGGDFISDVKQGKSVFPNIVVMIYDMQAFKEMFEDLCDEQFVPFTRTCSKYGINFVVTSSETSTLGYRAENNFPQKIMLNMVDSSDYSAYFEHPPIPSKNPGRGIIELDNVYEFQVPLIYPEEVERKNLEYVLMQLNKYLKNSAKPVPTIPDVVTLDYVKPYFKSLSAVPLGVNLKTAQIGYFNFSNLITLISTSKSKNSQSFLSSTINMISTLDKTTCMVLNAEEELKFNFDEKVKLIDSGFKQVSQILAQNIQKYKEEPKDKQFVIFILGYATLQAHLEKAKQEDSTISTIDELVNEARGISNFKFVIFDNDSLLRSVKNNSIFADTDFSTAIWIGKGVDSQSIIDAEISYRDEIKQTNDTLALIKSERVEYLKYIKD